MGNLDTLKVAAFVLRDLKNNERVYKTALVKVASKEIYKAKTGRPYMEKAALSGWADFGNAVAQFTPVGWAMNLWDNGKKDSTDPDAKGEYDTYSNWQKAKNYWGRAFGRQDSQAIYANSNEFANQSARDAYLNERATANKYNLQDLRDKADNNLADWNERKARSLDRGQSQLREADEAYNAAEDSAIRDRQNRMQRRLDRMYNSPGLYGGPTGLSPHVGGPASYRPRTYGPYATGWYGGTPLGSRPGYGYGGRPYGSVYSRGGYGGRGYGGYGGYYGRGYGGYGGYYGP